MASRLRELCLATGLVCLVACGSSSDDGLLSGGGGKKDAGADGTSGASAGGTAGVSGQSGSAGVAGADAGIDATAGAAGAGGIADAGGDASDGGGGTTQKGVGPCGTATCAFLAEDYCCKPSNAAPYCANETVGNDCECSGVACQTLDIHCDGPEDCPTGQICCADTGFFGGPYDVIECRETCKQPPITGGPQWEVCHPGGQPCANGADCKLDAAILPGYSSCKP